MKPPNPPTKLTIRYRDKHGHFVSSKKAAKLSGVISEVYDSLSGKKIGSKVKGFYKDIKKLQREAMPTFKAKAQKTYTPRRVPKPITSYIDFSEEWDSELDDDDINQFEEDWQELYEEDFGELDDYLDDLEDLLEDDGEWYEEA